MNVDFPALQRHLMLAFWPKGVRGIGGFFNLA